MTIKMAQSDQSSNQAAEDAVVLLLFLRMVFGLIKGESKQEIEDAIVTGLRKFSESHGAS